MNKTRYDETQLKSHPRRNRKQNELVKAMLKQLDLMLGENHAGELLAVFVDLLKRAVNETPDGKLELRSIEIILNDYFHAKDLADGAQFKIDEDHKKLRAFDIIKSHAKEIKHFKYLLYMAKYWEESKIEVTEELLYNYDFPYTVEEFNFLKEAFK